MTPALFPGYLFLLVDLQWHAARCCPGVTKLIMNGERPAKVPDRIIEELRGRERNGVVELPEPPPRLRSGGRVRIAAGPLKGLRGIYVGQNGHARVHLLLALLGGQQRVTLPASDVEAV